jgi:hypothetical protein
MEQYRYAAPSCLLQMPNEMKTSSWIPCGRGGGGGEEVSLFQLPASYFLGTISLFMDDGSCPPSRPSNSTTLVHSFLASWPSLGITFLHNVS